MSFDAEVRILDLRSSSISWTIYPYTKTATFSLSQCYGQQVTVKLPNGVSIGGIVRKLTLEMYDPKELEAPHTVEGPLDVLRAMNSEL